jgi:hypothetical protein
MGQHKTLSEFFAAVSKVANKEFNLNMPRLPGSQYYHKFTGKDKTFKKNQRKGL